MEYEFHSYCLMFPQADQKIISDMADDIKLNGQNDAIILYEGKILDGRNRYLACKAAGVEPIFKEYAGDDPLQFVISKNLHRRHLNESQRAMLAQKVWKMLRGEDSITQEDVRKQFNISESSVRKAARVDDLAIDDIKKNVEAGVLSLNKASEVVKQAKKEAGITSNHFSKSDKVKIKQAQKNILQNKPQKNVPEVDTVNSPLNLDAEEFNSQVLSGVYDGKRYRRDVQEIQTAIAKLASLPTLFDDAISLVGTLEQEKMLLAALDMLSSVIKNAENKLQLHPISYDEVMTIISDILNERFKLPENVQEVDERALVKELKQQYLNDCATVEQEITRLRHKIKNS